jgi:hypothetical protein
MPLHEHLTREDIVRRIAEVATSSTAVNAQRRPEEVTEAERQWATAASNTGYFILQALGFTHAEIVEIMRRG